MLAGLARNRTMDREPYRRTTERRASRVLVAACAAAVALAVLGAPTSASSQKSGPVRRVLIAGQISLELPKPCVAIQTVVLAEGGYGAIDCGAAQPRVEYAWGLGFRVAAVGSVLWSRREYLEGRELRTALVRDLGRLMLVAELGMVSFKSEIRAESEAKPIVAWLRTLKVGLPCPDCEQPRREGRDGTR
jgi:hypothetical protein